MNTWGRLGPLLQKSMLCDKKIKIKIEWNHGVQLQVHNVNL